MDEAATDRPVDRAAGGGPVRAVAGKIAEIRVFYDTLGLMRQIGAAPIPAEVAGARSDLGR